MSRMFRLSDASHKDIDLREYEDEILEIADRIIPGKNPKVYQNYFMTDELTQGERVRLGRELSKSPRLKQYGKEVTSFRLFEGKSVEETQKCQYLSIADIQKEYLPISRKKLRMFVKRYLDAKMIGNRIFVSREELEEVLHNPENTNLPIR